MAEILIEDEASLVQAIRESEAAFGDFQATRLESKVERERKGWEQLPLKLSTGLEEGDVVCLFPPIAGG